MTVYEKIKEVVLSYEPNANVYLGRKDFANLESNETSEIFVFVDIENRSSERITDKAKFFADETFVILFLHKDSIDNNDGTKAALIDDMKLLARQTIGQMFLSSDIVWSNTSELRFSIVPVLDVLSGYFIGASISVTIPQQLFISFCKPI